MWCKWCFTFGKNHLINSLSLPVRVTRFASYLKLKYCIWRCLKFYPWLLSKVEFHKHHKGHEARKRTLERSQMPDIVNISGSIVIRYLSISQTLQILANKSLITYLKLYLVPQTHDIHKISYVNGREGFRLPWAYEAVYVRIILNNWTSENAFDQCRT